MTYNVRYERIRAGAHFPTKGTERSAGSDIRAIEGGTLPGQRFEHVPAESGPINDALNRVVTSRALVKTGLRLHLPPNLQVNVVPRSGMALKAGVTVLNAPGLVDPDYEGELGVILVNNSPDDFTWEAGDRIAQITFQRVEDVEAEFDEAGLDGPPSPSNPDAKRGEGGFGSTGSS